MKSIFDSFQINCRNIKLDEDEKNRIIKKLTFLDRFSKYIDQINIEIEENRGEAISLKYEVNIKVKHGIIRAEEKGVDLFSIIDQANDKVKIKIEKYKDKYTDHAAIKETAAEEPSLEDSITKKDTLPKPVVNYIPRITKRKSYSDNRPLHPAEAIEQMEMLGHISFLFKNIETDKYTMVYKRDDGNYGIIEPENA